MKKFLMCLPLIILGVGGCATNQPKPIQKPIQKTIIYEPSLIERKAIAILIYKQKNLEHRIKNLEEKKSKETFGVKRKKTSCKFNNQKVSKLCKNIDINSFYIAKDNVNIRKCATIHSPIVGTVKKGTKVKFLYCNKYCWCLLNDKRGYVSYKLFNKKNENNIKKMKTIGKEVAKTVDIDISKINKTPNKGNIKADEIIKNYINSK